MTFKKIKSGFSILYGKIDKTDDKTFLLKMLKLHLENYGIVPTKIIMNKNNIKFLGNARGIEFGGYKIPVDTARNCLIDNILFS